MEKMNITKVRDTIMTMTLTNSNVRKAVKSYCMSKRYITTMLKATVINILYHRLNIDNKEFINKNFNEVPYKSFRSKSKNSFIREFHTYMTACKDALDKNYLREFYLFFIDLATGDILENYKFQFGYEEVETHEPQDENNLRENTCELLKTLAELGKHEKLGREIQIKVEFTYLDETPEEYEPPGFRNIELSDSMLSKVKKNGNSVVIGTLFTGFHMMKCRGRGEIFNFNTSMSVTNEMEANIKDTNMQMEEEFLNTNLSTSSNDMLLEEPREEPLTTDEQVINTIAANKASNTLSVQNKKSNNFNESCNITQGIEYSSEEEEEVNCPCKLPVFKSLSVDQIMCTTCKRVYHTPCQGYLDNSFIKEEFCCSFCKGDTESLVAHCEIEQSMSLYRTRFIVGAIYKYGKVPMEFKSLFNDTLKNLEKLKFFELHGDKVKLIDAHMFDVLFKFEYKTAILERLESL